MIKAIIFDFGGVVFTNGTKKFIKNISERYGLDEALVKDVMDGEIGSAYYELALKKAGIKPEEAVFIDDKSHFLPPPAAALGMKTIVFENPEQVADELKRMGIPSGGLGS